MSSYAGINSDSLDKAIFDLKQVFPGERTYLTSKAEAMAIRWSMSFLPVLEQYDVLAVEEEFLYPLLNPETEASSRTFMQAGKMDGILRNKRTGEVKLLEHKTSSDKIGQDSDYWLKLTMDFQITAYLLALRQQGYNASTVLYDVIRKPMYKPSAIPMLDENCIKIVIDLNGERVKNKDGKSWRQSPDTDKGYTLRTVPENPDQYFERIYDSLEAAPHDFFVKKEIPRSDADLLAFMKDSWSQGQAIIYNRNHELWPRNPDACHAYSTCEMFDLCAGRHQVNGVHYARKEKRHTELSEATNAAPDKTLITSSSLRALRKCPRYYFLKYEEPTIRVGDDNENLVLGTLFHKAAEAFLTPFIVK